MVKLDQILKGCRQYNKFAQKLLYDMYAPKMMGICIRYVNDPEVAKDIMQDGFIKVFSKIKQFGGKGSFEGWIKRVFINTAISYLRKKQKKNYINFDNINESDVVEEDIHPSEKEIDPRDLKMNGKKPNIDVVLLADLSEKELLSALYKIPETFRIVFNLFCIERIKHEEIAKMLDINVATSRSRLSRARSLIQKELYAFCIEKLTQ